MRIAPDPPMQGVRALLERAGLPVADLDRCEGRFFGCGPAQAPGGVVGIELYGTDALLRSLAVASAHRGKGCAASLVAEVERYARAHSVRRVYLLTETAQAFFERHGYRVLARESAPEGIRASSEFSSLCPASAAFMGKDLD